MKTLTMRKNGLQMGLCALILVTFISTVNAGEVRRRQRRGQARIGQGVKSGEMTAGETARAERGEGRIAAVKDHDLKKDGGTLTNKDKAQLNRMEKREGHEIYREKHNNRTQGNPTGATPPTGVTPPAGQ